MGKIFFILCGLILALGVIWLGVMFWMFTWGSEATIAKANMTREEAVSYCNIPLPVSASNISCYSHAEGMQGLTRFVRFDVEQAELPAAVEAIMAYKNTGRKQHVPFTRRELSRGSEEHITFPHRIAEGAGLAWWEPKSILKGYYLEYIQFFVARLWILDR